MALLSGRGILTATDIGLGNVDDTSDINKPISIATQGSLDAQGVTLVNHQNELDTHQLFIDGNQNVIDSKLSAVIAPISQTLTSNAVDWCIYDTSKDFDSGKWRERTADLSWFKETIQTGNFLGHGFASALDAANSISTAVIGDWYGSSNGNFYQLTGITGSPTTATAATSGPALARGESRKFPAKVLIVAEAAKVTIYDYTKSLCPMWMVFDVALKSFVKANPSSVRMLGNNLIIGENGVVAVINFMADKQYEMAQNATYTNNNSIADRNITTVAYHLTSSTVGIVNNTVNSVAITYLPDAPLDDYGMRLPTIAVGTAGGLSVIHNTDTVNSITDSTGSYPFVYNVYFTAENKILFNVAFSNGGTPWVDNPTHIISLPTTTFSYSWVNNVTATVADTYIHADSSVPNILPISNTQQHTISSVGGRYLFRGGDVGLNVLVANPSSAIGLNSNSMVAYLTNTYNTGWMVGDIRRAYLANSGGGIGGDLVTNGTFATDIAGWTNSSTGTCSIVFNVAGNLDLICDGTGSAYATQILTTEIGKTYRVSLDVLAGAAGADILLYIGTTLLGSEISSTNVPIGVGNIVEFTAATTTTTHLTLREPTTGTTGIDNISASLVGLDRSVKNGRLTVNGTITETTVGEMTVYSGFSATNYLSEASHADWNAFGTGDFSIVMSGVKWGTAGVVSRDFISMLSITTTPGSWQFAITSGGSLVFGANNGTAWADRGFSTSTYTDSATHHLALVRRSGVIYVYVDGGESFNFAYSASVSPAATPLRIGCYGAGLEPWTGGQVAQVRISATAPTPEQIKHMAITESKIFEPTSKALLSASAVTRLDYNEDADITTVHTASAVDYVRGLEVVNKGLSTNDNTDIGFDRVSTNGTNLFISSPTKSIYDELAQARHNNTKQQDVIRWLTTNGITDTYQIKGINKPKEVILDGKLQREGNGNDYNIAFDGFVYSIVFFTVPTAGLNIAVKSNGSIK